MTSSNPLNSPPKIQSGIIHYEPLVELVPRIWVPLNRKIPRPPPDYYNPYSLRYQVLCDQRARDQGRLDPNQPKEIENQKDLIDFG